MCFRSYGYCADSTVVVEGTVITDSNEYDGTMYIQYDNQFLTLRSIQEQSQRNFISKMYLMYNSGEKENVKNFLSLIMSDLLNGYYGANGVLITEDATNYQYRVSIYNKGNVTPNGSGGYGYNFGVSASGSYSGAISFEDVSYSSVACLDRFVGIPQSLYPAAGVNSSLYVPTAFYDVFISEWLQMFKDFGLLSSSSDNEVLNELVEQNQLQQEQNQIQQEQNDFLKQETSDDDVSVDSFNSVDSNDITSDGLTGVFTNIYNSITNWSSKDIKLPIPYTSKSIVIPANYTQNMLNSFGGSWVITFISSIYYFIVARFIIYSITGIINSIKSGSILETDSNNNITTDML